MLSSCLLVGLGASDSIQGLWCFALLMGGYYGLTETAERALIRDLASVNEYGTAFGWYHLLSGMAAVLAGVGLGGLWSLAGSTAAFFLSATIASLCVFLLWRFHPR